MIRARTTAASLRIQVTDLVPKLPESTRPSLMSTVPVNRIRLLHQQVHGPHVRQRSPMPLKPDT